MNRQFVHIHGCSGNCAQRNRDLSVAKIRSAAEGGVTRWLVRPRASDGSQNRPAFTHTPAPRRRKSCERAGRYSREAAGCVRKAFLRSQTRVRSAAGGQACASCGLASAMVGSTKSGLTAPRTAAPARARSAPAEILRALRRAREAACFLRKALLRRQTSARSAAVRVQAGDAQFCERFGWGPPRRSYPVQKRTKNSFRISCGDFGLIQDF